MLLRDRQEVSFFFSRRHNLQWGSIKRRPRDLRQDLIFGPEGLRPSIPHDQQQVKIGQSAGSMCNNDNYSPALTYPKKRISKGCFPFRVEIGVRLIKQHKERISVERPGQGYSLTLTGR